MLGGGHGIGFGWLVVWWAEESLDVKWWIVDHVGLLQVSVVFTCPFHHEVVVHIVLVVCSFKIMYRELILTKIILSAPYQPSITQELPGFIDQFIQNIVFFSK